MLDRVFGNRYRLVEKIGIGGMAEVYKANDEVLGRTVAVKIMLPQYASDPSFAVRFKQEAQSAGNLQSPYIVNIYDWGHESADNTYYIAMEYVRGTDLKTAIQQRGAINQRKAAEIGSQVCAALSVAHSYDIIHRDIKPHNIMVQPDGNAKVMDFGIARASGSSMTQTGSVLGTAYYVSPEQARGKQLTPATDLYSLGIVLYEATTGRVPFDAPDAVAVALKQVNELPVPPRQINPNIDPELEAIIMRAMEKNSDDRYSTAEQMRTALNNYLAGRPVDTNVEPSVSSSARTRVMAGVAPLPVIGADGAQPPTHTAVMPSVATPQAPLNVRSSSRAKEEEQKRKRRTAVVVATIAALFCIAIIGVVIYMLSSDGAQSVEVPDVVNLSEADARKEIESKGLKVGKVEPTTSPDVEPGRVVSSNPSARTVAKPGSTVDLKVSTGPEQPKQAEVPNLRDKTPDDAKAALEAVGLKYDRGDDRYDPEIAVGRVCAQNVEAGTMADVGRIVTYYVSKGKETGVIPNVVGATEQEARDYLKNNGFEMTVAEDREYSDIYAEGVVIRQSPVSGISADKGSTVTVTLSKGPEPPEQVAMPNLVGLSESDALDAIYRAGLVPNRVYKDTALIAEVGKVISQSPLEKSMVTKGDTVTITVGRSSAPTSP